jgi:hypothetical protein
MAKMRVMGSKNQADEGGLKFNLRELGGALGDFGPLHPPLFNLR